MFSASSKHDAKVVILGASGVGKTCIGVRFVKDQFVAYTAPTIGASFLVKELAVSNQKITLQIWDTAGQERFRSMAPLYYRGAVAAILVFAINDQSSFEKLKEWVRELQSNVEEPLVLAIACNKADMAEQRTVLLEKATAYIWPSQVGYLIRVPVGQPAAPGGRTWTLIAMIPVTCPPPSDTSHRGHCTNMIRLLQGQAYAESIGALIFETSAKNNVGVSELFHEVAKRLLLTRFRATEASGIDQFPSPVTVGAAKRDGGCCA